MWDYTETVKDHFFNPRNVGVVENPDGTGQVGSLACGDALKLTFKLDDQGKIADVKFQTFGCGSAIASSSALTELIKGKTLEEAEKVTNKDIADYLGGLPEQKMHCSVMGREALIAAIENYRTGSTEAREIPEDILCTCFGVTESEVRTVIQENDLHTIEEVTNYCKAGGGCTGCHSEIQRVLDSCTGRQTPQTEKPTPVTTTAAQPLTNIQKIKLVEKTLDEQVRPALQTDGGDIELIDVVGNRVIIALRGMCAQCQVADFTLRDVVQARLREFVSPDIIVQEQKK